MNGRSASATAGVMLAALTLTGCGRADETGPPTIHYGDSLCAECGMILSDERFAAATVIKGERGRALPLLFDDLNCQSIHEQRHPEPRILARWVHDHSTRRWIDARGASFVHAPTLRTPMASHVAAFASPDAARDAAKEWKGRVLAFEELWAAGSFDEPAQEPAETSGSEEQGETP